MGELLYISNYEDDRHPHISGIARCLKCGHEWSAVAPANYDGWLECSECGLFFGRFKYSFERSDEHHWRCHCGNDLFHLTPKGMYCPCCGAWQYGWEEE